MVFLRPSYFISLFYLAVQLPYSVRAGWQAPDSVVTDKYPQRIIAGVPVIDTPIVRAAQEFARKHSAEPVYNHVMRSWLFGSVLIANNDTLNKVVDKEVHAISALLHDLGWDRTPGSTLVSADKRFEVDGAIAARDFIQSYNKGRKWDSHRVQLVWDAIALHSQPSIFDYKEPEVRATGRGIQSELFGLAFGISKDVYDAIVAEFPNDDFVTGAMEALTWLCQTKPETTYDTMLQPFGEALVANYSAVGHRMYDLVFPST